MAESLLWWLAVLLCGAFVMTLVPYLLDNRTIDGFQSVWAKPLRFELSLALHAATLAFAISLMSPAMRADRILMAATFACIAATCFELVYIVVQAARQEESHFNVDSPASRMLYGMMAFGAVLLIGAAAIVGVMVAFDTESGISPALRFGVAAGLICGAVLTLVTAFTIGARLSPYVGPPPGDARFPLTGWSLTGGDLRLSHFLATHMMQSVPLAAVVLSRVAPQGLAVSGTFVFAAFWVAWTIMEFRTALGGEVSTALSIFRLAGLH